MEYSRRLFPTSLTPTVLLFFCTKPQADEIKSLPFPMAVRYFVTNPNDAMMIKIVSSMAIVDSNDGAIIVVRRYVSIFMNIPSQNNNIHLGISGFRVVSRIIFAELTTQIIYY